MGPIVAVRESVTHERTQIIPPIGKQTIINGRMENIRRKKQKAGRPKINKLNASQHHQIATQKGVHSDKSKGKSTDQTIRTTADNVNDDRTIN